MARATKRRKLGPAPDRLLYPDYDTNPPAESAVVCDARMGPMTDAAALAGVPLPHYPPWVVAATHSSAYRLAFGKCCAEVSFG